MKLQLIHGRHDPEQNMEDWGFSGPTLEEILYVHNTYNTTVTVGFKSKDAADRAYKLTGWRYFDTNILEISFFEDMIQCDEANGTTAYYGDWELQEEFDHREFLKVLQDLLYCTDLNLDELDVTTIKALQRMKKFLKQHNRFFGELPSD